MSKEENINKSFLYDVNNPLYYATAKIEFSKIVGMKITGAIWSRWDAYICLKDSSNKRYVLYVFHNSDTGEPDFIIFNENSGLECFKISICWRKKDYKKWVKKAKDELKNWEKKNLKNWKESDKE